MPNTMNQTHTRVFLKRLKLCQLCHREIVRTFSFICGLWYRIYCRGLLHDHKSAKSNILWQKQLMNNYFWGKLWLIVGGWYVWGISGRLVTFDIFSVRRGRVLQYIWRLLVSISSSSTSTCKCWWQWLQWYCLSYQQFVPYNFILFQ